MREATQFNLLMLQMSKPSETHLKHSSFNLPIGNNKDDTIKLVLRI